jgi:hypothetical protein
VGSRWDFPGWSLHSAACQAGGRGGDSRRFSTGDATSPARSTVHKVLLVHTTSSTSTHPTHHSQLQSPKLVRPLGFVRSRLFLTAQRECGLGLQLPTTQCWSKPFSNDGRVVRNLDGGQRGKRDQGQVLSFPCTEIPDSLRMLMIGLLRASVYGHPPSDRGCRRGTDVRHCLKNHYGVL